MNRLPAEATRPGSEIDRLSQHEGEDSIDDPLRLLECLRVCRKCVWCASNNETISLFERSENTRDLMGRRLESPHHPVEVDVMHVVYRLCTCLLDSCMSS